MEKLPIDLSSSIIGIKDTRTESEHVGYQATVWLNDHKMIVTPIFATEDLCKESLTMFKLEIEEQERHNVEYRMYDSTPEEINAAIKDTIKSISKCFDKAKIKDIWVHPTSKIGYSIHQLE